MKFWKRTKEESDAVPSWQLVIDGLRKDLQTEREAIGRLIKRNGELFTQLSDARAETAANASNAESKKDEGATYVLSSLAECLGLEDWSIQDGSETWEGDVSATLYRILVDAGVVDEEDNAVATHAAIAANLADAQLWRNAREKRKQGRAAA